MRLVALTGAASLVIAAAPVRLTFKRVRNSSWGGLGITFTPHDGVADVLLDCASIKARLPYGMPTTGTFILHGLQQRFRPGPQLAEDMQVRDAGEPAKIVGQIVGPRLRLTITSGAEKHTYSLARGGGPGPRRCL